MINDTSNCVYITSVKCIRSDVEMIFFILLVLRVDILYMWKTHNNFDGKTSFGTQTLNYLNDNVAS